MEAVPKLPMLSFELKVSHENTHFGPKLKQYIAEAYREDPDSYSNEIHQLEGLRSAAVRPTIDSVGLSALIRYFCQLRSLQSRFPMAKGQPAACSFSWKDLYANMNRTLADIRFEMASILYNIGALLTQLGAAEPRNTADSLKTACTHFQHAAWVFQYLREQLPQPSGVDVCSEIMRMMQEICFALAQECILEKSIQDTRKPSVVGAVATQVMYFYKNSLGYLGPTSGADIVHEIVGTKLYNYWHRYLSFKLNYIGCVVCLYQGMHAEEQQKMGERVAFYQHAVERLAEARKLTKNIEPAQVVQEALTFTNDVVEGKRKAAKNENEFIYHEEVPEKDVLSDMKPVCLVKALPINFNDPEVSGTDVFSRLVPMMAHEASSVYSEEKAQMLRHIVGLVEAKNTELTEFMSSLQLDQLDVIESDQKVPQEIVDRCAAMNAKTEIIQTLVDSMNNLAEIISDVEESLAEIKEIIQDETTKEKEYQKIMGPRPPSIVQTELSREFHKYEEAHARTNESNQVLHKAMTLHIANLRLLAQPLDVLQCKIPSIDNIVGLDRETMTEMRRVVGKVREMQTQRDSLVQQLREAVTNDDITSQLLARNNEPKEEIFKQELKKHNPTIQIIEANLAAQENIINKLTSVYASYGDSRRLLSDVLRKREGLINALITSYDTYEELLGKSQKGLEFYAKLSHNVSQLLTRLRSTCQVQREERAQLLAKQQGKASTPTPTAAASPPPAKQAEASAIVSQLPPSLAAGGGPRKLKDYLPYMKNRNRGMAPQAPVEPIPLDSYYPEGIYPTSVRPTPVGSEATDINQTQLPDGVVMPPVQAVPSPYDRYLYGPSDSEPYAIPSNYLFPNTSKTYEKPSHEDLSYGYSTYTPQQFSTNTSEQQIYSNPYYANSYGAQNNATVVTDSQNFSNVVPNQVNMNPNQGNVNPNQGNVNPNQGGMNPNQVSMNPNQVSMNPNQVGMNLNQVSMNPNQVNVNPNIPNQINVNPNQVNVNPNQMNVNQNQVNVNLNQINVNPNQSYEPYMNQMGPIPESSMSSVSAYSSANQTDMIANFAQMHVSGPKHENPQDFGADYSQTFYSVQYPNVSTPGSAAYTSAPQNSNTSLAPSQMNSDYSTLNYPYSNESTQYSQQVPTFSAADPSYNYATTFASTSQGYTYTNANTSTTSSIANSNSLPYSFTSEMDNYNPALSQLDAIDKPIKSHAKGEALSSLSFQPSYQNYGSNVPGYSNQPQTYNPTSTYGYTDQTNTNFSQSYQNHPGYNFNSTTGTYEYNFGSQNSYTYDNTVQENVNYQPAEKDQNWQQPAIYTSAGNVGTCETVQSPTDNSQIVPQMPAEQGVNNQMYYNNTYGYQSVTSPVNDAQTAQQTVPNNYVVNANQQGYVPTVPTPQDHHVTFNSGPVTAPSDNVEPKFETYPNVDNQSTSNVEQSTPYVEQSTPSVEQNTPSVEQSSSVEQKVPETVPTDTKPQVKPELTAFDLLSEIDFSVEQTPLMPEIKVPQISESAIRKPMAPRVEPVKKVPVKEEVIERPAKRDLFSDPSLLNQFTQEVKNLQKLTDSLTNKMPCGLTVLDSKWKNFQDFQTKQNMTRSKTIAMQHTNGNIVTEVVPYDDSRLTLKSDPDAFINASYYKQLASWCIPLVISKNPSESEYTVFWKAVLENKISCIVCLLSEIEMQGKTYWPTAKGQSLDLSDGLKVLLDEVTCTVHWTERKLTVATGKTVLNVTHYQINVFPAKIVCSPLVLLADKLLSQTYDGRLSNQLCGAWVQDAAGAGRSCVLALLLMLMCQVRAGQMQLCDMLDAGCMNLYTHRSNVLEDTKYLADAYRTALFYVQGVLCSGTTMFNGEAVSLPSGAAVLPPVTPTSNPSTAGQKPTKFSRESFEEMKQSPGLKSGDMKDPLNFLDPLWSLKKK
ncbi:tyrosine-protein phosphatase non-receptor type 23 [Helicoverpa zea]|uniref:tyrosine-protein phosphatase non-receptor type 23 n=1 Tax=Helicoverpa zea TaxID=7113 RepID=UPI001F5905DD|nr:tyrosine-protein phosphatase non-receptor type 23 [Helicoverpa zea]